MSDISNETQKQSAEINWQYPESLSEVPSLLASGYIPHGGGTTLVKSKLKSSRLGGSTENMNRRGIFDISRLKELKKFSLNDGLYVIGAGLTYAQIVSHISILDTNHLLVKALSKAASNALRNRITIGGSVATFPVWSDLAGPLLALDARVTLMDVSGKESEYSIEDYFKDREIGREKLILAVKVIASKLASYYYREVRTRFDYPLFTVSILADGNTISDCKIVVTGVKGKFKSFRADDFEAVELDFPNRQGISAEYLTNVAKIQIKRGIEKITGLNGRED